MSKRMRENRETMTPKPILAPPFLEKWRNLTQDSGRSSERRIIFSRCADELEAWLSEVNEKLAGVEKLTEMWQEKRRYALIDPTTSQIFRAGALGVCIDELSAALAALRGEGKYMATVYRCDRCKRISEEMLTVVEFRPVEFRPSSATHNKIELCTWCAKAVYEKAREMPAPAK